MALPLMSEVFVLREASMHTWRNLGFSPEVKAFFERHFGRVAYEAAIAYLPWFVARETAAQEGGYLQDPLPEFDPFKKEKDAAGIVGAEMTRAPVSQEMLERNPKLAAEFRRRASEILSSARRERATDDAGTQEAWDIVQSIKREFVKEPENYGGETFLDAGDGWRWVKVEGDLCQDWEGRLMQHCGAPDAEMISLRDPQGKPHVSVDFSPPADLNGFGTTAAEISQIKGKQNEFPDRKYWPAIGKLWRHLGEPEITEAIGSQSRAFFDFLDSRQGG